ncbi:MAG: PAS domain S-box protein, partial [Alphaproteobacteria bacterium]
MKAKIEQFPAKNPNPVLSVAKDSTVLYSNEAGEPLLHEWKVEIGEKLPSSIVDRVQRVISRNSPEKMEVKAGNRVYLIVFHPLPEQECVNISGFDISDQKEVEGKLRESENKYRNIVETSVEGIWIFNALSETTYVNEKMAEMLGYKPEEVIGRFIWDFASEEDKDIFQIKLANRKQGIDEVYELKLIRKDGSPLWVSVSAKGFFDDAGKFEGSVGMFTDITDRRRAEEALRESEEKYRVVADNTYDWEF